MAYSADRKPLELTALNSLATDDTFVVGDTSDTSEVAKSITKANLITDLTSSFATVAQANATHTGDATGATALTLATVNSNVGSYTNANITVNAKGLITAASTGSGLSDGDKGDITVSASGATWTIDNGAVSLAKQADMATASVVYRKTAGTGVPEVQTLATLKTDLGLTGTNSGDQTSIVGITGTKAQFDTAVSDGNIMYDGDSITNATATADRVFYANNAGAITELALGADGTFLKSNGPTAAPSFATPSGSGDVSKVGTPVDNQIGVWTGSGTIEGDAALTFDTTTDTVNTPNVIVSSVAGQTALTTFAPGVGGSTITPHLQVLEPSGVSAGIGFARFASATASQAPRFVFSRSRGTTIADYTVVQSGDCLGEVSFGGSDGTNFAVAGAIAGFVDGTPGNDDMPGRIVFSTTADGAAAITDRIIIDSAGALKPATNDGSALGNTSNQFSDLFLAEGAVINFDNGDATITQTGNVLAVAGADLQVATAGVGTNADSVPTISSTNTLTNKRVTLRTGTTTSSATPTINTDNVDFYSLTAQTVDITSFTTNLSGTPTEGQKLQIAITGTAARAITWGASFEASTVALPTTTVTTARLDVGFVWNTVTSKWRCIAAA